MPVEPKLLNDCFLHDKDRLTHFEAINILRENLSCIVTSETIGIEQALGRISAETITAPRNIPFHDNSAVDGYAFRHADFETTNGHYPISGRVAAGASNPDSLASNSAVRIFTGAPMPQGADTVVMQEDCKVENQAGNDHVHIPKGLKRGANCRKAGEDVLENDTLFSSGYQMRPQDIAAVASCGISTLSVYRKLKLGLLSTGDEIIRTDGVFEAGKVFDTNYYLLSALSAAAPVDVKDLGVCRDDYNAVRQTLSEEIKRQDVIVTSGGASRGEEDHLVKAITELGDCEMWQLAIKPGRPMCFGVVDGKPIFVLPGNPVAAFVCFLLYVRPALFVLSGADWTEPQRYPLPAAFEIKSKPDRREFLRGFTETSANGVVNVNKYDRDGSGLISGLRAATGLIEIPEDTVSVSKGDMVSFIPFSSF